MIDRFGQIAFEPVPLERFELASKWKKLETIQNEAAKLIGRYREAENEARALAAKRDAARDTDLETAASAVRAGKDAPEPRAVPALERKLVAATRTREILERAAGDAIGEAQAERQRHAAGLASDIQAALDKSAAALADHARQAVALYAKIEDGRRDAARLVPPPAPPAETGPPGSGEAARSTVLASQFVATTSQRTASPDRGTVERVLSHLAALA